MHEMRAGCKKATFTEWMSYLDYKRLDHRVKEVYALLFEHQGSKLGQVKVRPQNSVENLPLVEFAV